MQVSFDKEISNSSQHSIILCRFSSTVATVLLLKFHLVADGVGILLSQTRLSADILCEDREKYDDIPYKLLKKIRTRVLCDVARCKIKFN